MPIPHGIKRGIAFQIGDDIPRPQQNQHRHRRKIQGRVYELHICQTMSIQNAPQRIGDIVSQNGKEKTAIFSQDLRCLGTSRQPQYIPIRDDQNDPG